MKIVINKQRGFTLIEIMLVIAIIALLATFAVPQVLRSRMIANEVAAIAALRTISSACQQYYNDIIPHTYPANLRTLTLASPPYIDSALALATTRGRAKQGYYYTYTRIDSEHFTVIAWPSFFGRTGARNFFTNETGIVTFTAVEGAAPNEDSPTVVQ